MNKKMFRRACVAAWRCDSASHETQPIAAASRALYRAGFRGDIRRVAAFACAIQDLPIGGEWMLPWQQRVLPA